MSVDQPGEGRGEAMCTKLRPGPVTGPHDLAAIRSWLRGRQRLPPEQQGPHPPALLHPPHLAHRRKRIGFGPELQLLPKLAPRCFQCRFTGFNGATRQRVTGAVGGADDEDALLTVLGDDARTGDGPADGRATKGEWSQRRGGKPDGALAPAKAGMRAIDQLARSYFCTLVSL